MKAYIIEMFEFNQRVNEMMIESTEALSEPIIAIRLLSHLINSQNKWLARINEYPKSPQMDWWEPVYPYDRLKSEFRKSTNAWLEFLRSQDEHKLNSEVRFIGDREKAWSCKLKDIALQLVHHSFHHRAQMQTLIRQAGLKPRFIDYIHDKYTEVLLDGE